MDDADQPVPNAARERWNRRYTERGARPFPAAPSPWLVENRAVLPGRGARRALDVACGDGRDAAYLAQRGFTVDAVDISDVAIGALRAAAVDQRLAVNPLRLDLEREPLPSSSYDVVVQFNYLQRSLFGALADALVPGGILIIETITRRRSGEPAEARFRLGGGELLSSFPSLETLCYEESTAECSGRPTAVAGLVARRPVTRLRR